MGSSWLKELLGNWVGDGVVAWATDAFSGAWEVCKAVVGSAGMVGPLLYVVGLVTAVSAEGIYSGQVQIGLP